MRVAIDSGPLKGGHSVRGVGLSTKGLIEALQKYQNEKDVTIDAVDFQTADLKSYDLLHYTVFHPFFINNPRIGSLYGKCVVTIHDLIPLLYPAHYPPGIRGRVNYEINKILLKHADALITVSETSKKDIVRFLDLPPDKVNVSYWGTDEIFKDAVGIKDPVGIKKRYNLPDRFVLYVGDVNYNKNLSTLIKACEIIKTPLVIVGKNAKDLSETLSVDKNSLGIQDVIRKISGKPHPEEAHLQKLNLLLKKKNVITTGFVPKEDLPGIYRSATVYCQPSFYEGFGLPVIEAFACELPVVIAKTQALVEIADGAAAIADPNSSEDLSEKISLLFNDSTYRLHLIRAGKKRSKIFSWDLTAKNTIDVYKRVLNK